MHSFLGLTVYYHAFVRHFASIASPLLNLLKKDVLFCWHDVQQQSFDAVKHALTQAPVLAFPEYDLPFILCTHASGRGIGAVLMHTVEGRHPHVIPYASRMLTVAESRYSVTHLETLAVVWALKHFRELILATLSPFTQTTLLSLIFHGKNLTGRLSRWFFTTEEFNPTFKYLPGKANVVVDALSRNIAVASVTEISNFSLQDLSVAQRQDSLWSKVIYALESGDDLDSPKLPVHLSLLPLKWRSLSHYSYCY